MSETIPNLPNISSAQKSLVVESLSSLFWHVHVTHHDASAPCAYLASAFGDFSTRTFVCKGWTYTANPPFFTLTEMGVGGVLSHTVTFQDIHPDRIKKIANL